MATSRSKLALIGIALLVALRITIGWHFFYEGVWKIANADKFSAEPFLAMSKGPAAPLFYAMLPDLDGSQRLKLTEVSEEDGAVTLLSSDEERELAAYASSKEGKAERYQRPVASEFADTKGYKTSPVYEQAWADYKALFDAQYGLEGIDAKKADLVYRQYLISLREYCTNSEEDIVAHFGSAGRYEAAVASGTNVTMHQKKRNWDEQMELRSEAKGFLAEMDGMTEEFQENLRRLVPAETLQAKGEAPRIILATNKLPVAVPFIDSRMAWLDMSVTYGLTAIGFCLMLGFCTRLASLGGAAFLVSVLMTQPPIPTIYPPAPAVVGHALFVDKNFVEMVGLLFLVAVPAGRYAGLDHFLYEFFGKHIEKMYSRDLDETAKGHGVPAPKTGAFEPAKTQNA